MNEESISESPKPGHHILPIEVAPETGAGGAQSGLSLEKKWDKICDEFSIYRQILLQTVILSLYYNHAPCNDIFGTKSFG